MTELLLNVWVLNILHFTVELFKVSVVKE